MAESPIYRIDTWRREAGMGRNKLYELWRAGRGPQRREVDGLIYITETPRAWLERVSARAEHA